MRTSELRNLSTEDLVQKEKTLKKELFDLNFQRKNGNVEKPSRFVAVKRDIAKILTILNEREKENGRKAE